MLPTLNGTVVAELPVGMVALVPLIRLGGTGGPAGLPAPGAGSFFAPCAVTFVTVTVIGAPVLTTGVARLGVPVASSTFQLKVEGEGALPLLEQTAFGNAFTSAVPVPNGSFALQSGTFPPPLGTVFTNVIPEKTGVLSRVRRNACVAPGDTPFEAFRQSL